VRQYRQGTAFEALVGYLYLLEKETRLEEILDFSFAVIQKALQENGGKKK
jgi:ribonuclease-3 family protein